MEIGVRNHFASICINYVKRQHPEDFEILKKLAEANYTKGSGPIYTISHVLYQFSEEKKARLAQ